MKTQIRMNKILIKGAKYSDERGTIFCVNDFDMSLIRRMYMIEHPDETVKRGWRAHRIEQRWFYVVQGAFEIKYVKISNWEFPDPESTISTCILTQESSDVLNIPKDFATCLIAKAPHSKLMVFSDYGIENATKDDYVFDINHFKLLNQ